MISAELSYRNYVPSNYIALEVSHLHFNGDFDITRILDNLIHLVEFDKYNEQTTKIKKLLEHKQINFDELQNWQAELKCFENSHLFWLLSKRLREERAILKAESEKLASTDKYLSTTIKQLENNEFYEASELTRKFKKILAELGFTCKASTQDDSNLHKEIYESTCSDEELIAKAEKMIAQLQQKQKEKLSIIDKKYSKLEIVTSKDISHID